MSRTQSCSGTSATPSSSQPAKKSLVVGGQLDGSILQPTLLDGVNDGQDELDGIVDLLRGKYAVLNMIPYNTIPDLPFRRPSWDKARAIAARLHERGVLTKLRDSAGQDVEGGCGQLRAREAKGRIISIKAA